MLLMEQRLPSHHFCRYTMYFGKVLCNLTDIQIEKLHIVRNEEEMETRQPARPQPVTSRSLADLAS